ncbi:MAG: acyl-[acyl-carrier-protein]--UDP-N-acetylglucosamine O-acyltransferase [Acidobacteria bacterium 21-70-11]|nr:MAG: acyl-[acyl-carrier-protein]--UDP-N-acetylglucosamine O-acyltransferase [Acidobacteria bacterium 21-70-11]OYW04317.1 MAG: acyl-[acyl-carrier-protein]--UDP-N-acetylglucosamine O-acyltransferase [Acidobacteria bacterium 37-71-11]
MATIHPSAVIDPKARLADDVVIGPYVVVEGEVEFGSGCAVGPFCRFEGPVRVGEGNRFVSHASIGAPPQDLKFKGDPTRLEIGPGNLFREFVTVHRGTPGGGGVTRLGGHSLYMIGAHVAHDCQVGDQVIFANNGTLAGHVHVGSYATVGALSAVHQFCSVGEYAFIGGGTIATKDVLPFMKTVGSRPARCFGPNSIGLERRGFSEERLRAIKTAWRYLRSPKLTTSEALERIGEELGDAPDAMRLLEFIRASERGVILANG